MKIIPYKKIIIEHSKTKAEISNIINNVTEPCNFWTNRYSSKLFCGQCDTDSFKIRRIIRYRNSFLPIINGKIYDTEVSVTMRLHHFASVFMLIWMTVAILTFIVISALIAFSLYKGLFGFFPISFGLIFAPVGFLMLKFAFWREVEKAELELKKLINS